MVSKHRPLIFPLLVIGILSVWLIASSALSHAASSTAPSSVTPCPASCWYHVAINPNYPATGNPVQRYFSAAAGNEIRAVISWWSIADAFGLLDQLPTDLGLEIYDPDGQLVPTVYDNNGQRVENGDSNSWHNNYEIVRFIARKTGTYRLQVVRIPTGFDEDNDLGIAVARVYRIFMPLEMKNQ